MHQLRNASASIGKTLEVWPGCHWEVVLRINSRQSIIGASVICKRRDWDGVEYYGEASSPIAAFDDVAERIRLLLTESAIASTFGEDGVEMHLPGFEPDPF